MLSGSWSGWFSSGFGLILMAKTITLFGTVKRHAGPLPPTRLVVRVFTGTSAIR
jgi:hypothetical protein